MTRCVRILIMTSQQEQFLQRHEVQQIKIYSRYGYPPRIYRQISDAIAAIEIVAEEAHEKEPLAYISVTVVFSNTHTSEYTSKTKEDAQDWLALFD